MQPAERFSPFRFQPRARPHGRITIPSVIRGRTPALPQPSRTIGADTPNGSVAAGPREMHTGSSTAAAHLTHQPGAKCQSPLPSTAAPPPSSPRAPSRQPAAAHSCLHIRRRRHPARRPHAEALEGNTQRAELMIACSRHGFIIRRPGVTQPSLVKYSCSLQTLATPKIPRAHGPTRISYRSTVPGPGKNELTAAVSNNGACTLSGEFVDRNCASGVQL